MTFSDCTDSTAPVYWLGRVGDLLAVRIPPENYTRLPDSHFFVHDLLDGQVVDQSPREQRTWEIAPNHLSPTDLLEFEEIRTGARGAGPYVWIDPATYNCFTPNIASGTQTLLTTEGFVVSGTGETIASRSNVVQRGTRALGWTVSPVPTGTGAPATSLAMTTNYAASGWATPPGQAWSMTGYLNSNGDYVPVFDGFESGAGSWFVSFGTIAQSAAQAHSGSNSGLMTSASSPPLETFAYRQDNATPGKTYTLGVWTRAGSQQNNVAAAINFQDVSTSTIQFNRTPLVMSSNVVLDTFSRTAASGWGTSDSAHVWSTTGGSSADYSVTSGTGRHSLASVGTDRATRLTIGGNDQTASVDITTPFTSATTQPLRWRVAVRLTDANNYYFVEMELGTDGIMRMSLNKRVTSSETNLVAKATVATNTSGNVFRVTMSAIGTALTCTARNVTTASATLTQSSTDAALTTGKLAQLSSVLVTGNTNTLPVVTQWDNYNVTSTPSPVGVWEYRTITATAPASTVTVRYGVVNTLIPPNGETLYIDDVTFSASTAITTITPQLAWINSSGAVLSITSGASLTASVANGWQAFSVSGSAPGGAVYVQPRMQMSSIAAVASPTIYLDTMMLDMRATARTWAVGQGQPRVAIAPTREVISRLGRTSMTYKMYEVST